MGLLPELLPNHSERRLAGKHPINHDQDYSLVVHEIKVKTKSSPPGSKSLPKNY